MNHYFRYYFSLLFHIYLSFHSSHYIPVQLFVHLIVIKITYIYNIPNFLHVCFLQPVNSKQNYLAIQKSEKHRYGGNWRPPFCLLPVCAFRYPHTRTRKYLWTHRLNRPYSRMYHLPSPFPLHFPFISSSLFSFSLSHVPLNYFGYGSPYKGSSLLHRVAPLQTMFLSGTLESGPSGLRYTDLASLFLRTSHYDSHPFPWRLE